MRMSTKLLAIAVLVTMLGAILSGCSSSNSTTVKQNVSERVSWNSSNYNVAFGAFGETGLLYVWKMSQLGGGMTLLTPSDNDADLSDEGGWHPSYSPDGTQVAIASDRGDTPSIYLISATNGQTGLLQRVTTNTGDGKDEMPSWSPDGSTIIYASTRPDNNYDICTMPASGVGSRTELIATAANEEWPCYNPSDVDQVVYQSDATGNTDIWTFTSPSTFTNLTAGSAFRDEAPSWSPPDENGKESIAFHSDRGGTFDIWKMRPDGSELTQLTSDARSDGFPVWVENADGTLRLAFTRNREVWSMDADGTDQKQLTHRPT